MSEYWNTTQVAEYLGVKVGTVSAYRSRGQMPAPDKCIGKRGHLWRVETITTWQEQRRAPGSDSGALLMTPARRRRQPSHPKEDSMSALQRWLVGELRSGMEECNASQADLARAAGLSQKHISEIMHGHAMGTLALWSELLDLVDRNPADWY